MIRIFLTPHILALMFNLIEHHNRVLFNNRSLTRQKQFCRYSYTKSESILIFFLLLYPEDFMKIIQSYLARGSRALVECGSFR